MSKLNDVVGMTFFTVDATFLAKAITLQAQYQEALEPNQFIEIVDFEYNEDTEEYNFECEIRQYLLQ